ncbi:penicillin-binding transpeptidase domain-containing protein [Sphaerisporangium aureirubrum]|uniref:Penicillin-binding transpeptidase domain-containing protein n=1 Tax=Sphaerisporangium aureirubrum TaxID=1544736 RepID=A0ABW1NXX6_9ACTN
MRDRWPLLMVAVVAVMVVIGVVVLAVAPDPVARSAERPLKPKGGAQGAPEQGRELTLEPLPAESTPGVPPFSPTALPSAPPSTSPVSTSPVSTSPASAPADAPEPVAARYFAAWQAGDFATMASLVDGPPADFADRHRRFSADLRIASLSLSPGVPRQVAENAAEAPFQGVREVTGLGSWPFTSVLRLTRVGGLWKVLWGPETLHPSLRDGGGLRIVETKVSRPATLTRDGTPFPADSRAGDYFSGLSASETRLSLEETPSGKVLLASPEQVAGGIRASVSRSVQSAAARALDGVAQPAAVVAVDVKSREVRAVADTLGAKGAFNGLYPPGSTFKVVTAAALLRGGLSPQSPVACPGTYTIPNGRSFTNADGADHGTVSLSTAFALSCNTTFARLSAERLRDGQLRAEAADRFGFREKPGLSSCRIRPHTTADELGADALGQNSVQASPLCMAEVAAAVASGVWRPAVLTPGADGGASVPLDDGVASSLRSMMAAVVTEGTAARAGLPSGTSGKTGTAEVAGARTHAWFIGYRDGLAFAVLVRNGGAGATAAAPIAAKFLKAL